MVERRIEMLLGDLSERAEFVNPSIHRQHVDMPRLRLDGRAGVVEVGEIGGVAPHGRGTAADCGNCLIELGLAVINIRAPSWARCLAMPRPMPAPPPVTSATLPASLLVILISCAPQLQKCTDPGRGNHQRNWRDIDAKQVGFGDAHQGSPASK